MIKKLCAVFFITTIVISVYAARERETFLKGNKLFHEGNVLESLKEYEEITKKGPILWYNIGVCKYQLNDFLGALIAFRKAERGATHGILQQILGALKKTQTKLEQSHDSENSILLKQYSSYFSLFWLQVLCILMWWICIVVTWYRARFKLIIVAGVWILFLWVVLTASSAWWVSFQSYGIITDDATLFIGTSSDFHKVGEVGKATQVILKKSSEGWYKVKASNITGWIPASKVEPLV